MESDSIQNAALRSIPLMGRNGVKTSKLQVRLSDADLEYLERLREAAEGRLSKTQLIRAALAALGERMGVERPAQGMRRGDP